MCVYAKKTTRLMPCQCQNVLFCFNEFQSSASCIFCGGAYRVLETKAALTVLVRQNGTHSAALTMLASKVERCKAVLLRKNKKTSTMTLSYCTITTPA